MSSLGRDVTTILVADDDPLIRMVLRHALESAGYEVLEARTGEAAVMAIATAELSLVILDAHMPGRGYEHTLTSMTSRRLAVLVLSGDTDITSGTPRSGLAFLTKPVDVYTLLSTVSALLGTDEPSSAHG